MQKLVDTFYEEPTRSRNMPLACTIEGHVRPVYPGTLYLVPGPGGLQRVCSGHYDELLHGKVMVAS